MKRKNTYTIYLRTMYTKYLMIPLLIFCMSCGEDGHGGGRALKATYFFINETDEAVLSDSDGYADDIMPNDTLVVVIEEETFSHKKPNKDNFGIFVSWSFIYKDGDNMLCDSEKLIWDISNYEDRKEVDNLVFEFTFRFTEERKAQAKPCLE